MLFFYWGDWEEETICDLSFLFHAVMSSDGRNSVISKSLANGAAHYILKPFSADDFKDIWQYARKLTFQNIEGGSIPGDNTSIQDVNSATSSNMNKRKRKYCPRMSSQMNKEGQSELILV